MKRRLPFIAVNLAGAAAFTAPFLLGLAADSGQPRSADAPWLLALLAPMLVLVAISEAGHEKMSSKSVALLGALAACAAVLRLPLSFAGANLFFFLPIAFGFVFGSSFGFLLGSLAMAASAIITGGIGPWLPFQMWAAGWVGAGAGMLQPLARRWRTGRPGQLSAYLPVVILAGYGFLAAFFFGAAMNLYFWPVAFRGDGPLAWSPGLGLTQTFRHYAAFYAVTSFGWDLIGGIANLGVILLVGKPVIDLFVRYQKRFECVYD
ncbi:MAG: ECF transporter S component [Actinomycetota bacterium]